MFEEALLLYHLRKKFNNKNELLKPTKEKVQMLSCLVHGS